MKKIAKTTIAFIAMLLLLLVAPAKQSKAQFSARISFQAFYDDLDPYGQWIDDPQYGYVWVPDAGPGFRPYYSNGHWVMTRYGAMWVSDYSWGWAPFHYGRWVYDSYYGWTWLPDVVWGPAWVSWRSGAGLYGWAPLGPGMTVSLSFFNSYPVANDWWVFVPDQYYLSPVFYNYSIAPSNNITYMNNTTFINNTYVNDGITYAAGPSVSEIERATKSKVRVYDVANTSRPGKTSLEGNEIKTYKPQVSRTAGANAAPKKAVTRDEFVKTNPARVKRNQENYNTSRKQQASQSVVQNKPALKDNTTREQTIQPNKIENKNNKPVSQQQPIEKSISPIEKRQTPQQSNKRVMPETPKRSNQSSPMEQRKVQEQKTKQPVMQEKRQPYNQPPVQMERRQMPQQNKPIMQSRQQTQPVQQRMQPVQQPRTQPVQQPRSQPVQQQKSQPGGRKKNG